jgi:hypothetical protein
VLLLSSALAVSLSLESTESPRTGVTVKHYRASSPSTDVTLVEVDLCAAGLHLDATRAPSSLKSTSSWAKEQGALVAQNGDFYKSGPVRVYGDAVGGTVRWPEEQRGSGDYSGEWYYRDYGWIAFGHDKVWFTHSKEVKKAGVGTGWKPDDIAPNPPDGTIALVSGFPELVTDGVTVTCVSPTDSDCFPDRSDMRQRHPRSAMGLSEDLETLYLVAVDGRTSSNTGMYGAELAETLGKLGAWVAFNIDGGGSTQLWVDGAHVNSPTEASRSVANHWGVFADEDWLSDRAGSCVSADVCEVIPPEGGLLDELGECFRSFGDREFWREESAGEGGHLYWTNAFQSDTPGNLAWWQLELEEAGRYGVEVYVDPDHGQFVSTGYVLRVGSTDHALTLDQGSASGWTSLGEFELNEGGRQWLQVNDHVDVSPPTDRRIVVDAIRLVRLDLPVEDTGDSGQDSGPDSMPGDSAPAVEGHDTPGSRVRIEGCGLPSAPGWLLSGLALMLVRRRL